MKKLVTVSLLAVTITAISCGPKDSTPVTPMGDEAPAYSSDLKAFAVGHWNAVEGGSVNPNKTWIFKEDGSFIMHTEDDWRAAGTWTVTDDVVMLKYETLDGKTFAAAQEEVKKAEEGGGQGAVARALGMEWVFSKLPEMSRFVVAEDKKHLEYWNGIQRNKEPQQDPTGLPGDTIPADALEDLGGMMNGIMPFELERLK